MGTWEENQARVSTIICKGFPLLAFRKLRHYSLPIAIGMLTAYCLLFPSSCQPDLSDDAIPFIPFPDQIINLSLPEYATLKTDGGLAYTEGGVRGVIIYRKNQITYIAYERNCSFHPNEVGSTVNIHSSNLFLIDDFCGSSFSLDEGTPTGGPAWRPLRRYRTYLNGSELTITSESLNGM